MPCVPVPMRQPRSSQPGAEAIGMIGHRHQCNLTADQHQPGQKPSKPDCWHKASAHPAVVRTTPWNLLEPHAFGNGWTGLRRKLAQVVGGSTVPRDAVCAATTPTAVVMTNRQRDVFTKVPIAKLCPMVTLVLLQVLHGQLKLEQAMGHLAGKE